MDKPIRAFIALELDERIRVELGKIQNKLQDTNADLKWVETKNIHLTLKFLGDISPKNIDAMAESIARSITSHKCFDIEIGELGAFPDILFPQVIWVGVTQNADRLKAITAEVDACLKEFKIKKDNQPFTAHITLGRTRSLRGKDQLVGALEETYLPAKLTQAVKSLTFFQSQISSDGPTYTALKHIPLKA